MLENKVDFHFWHVTSLISVFVWHMRPPLCKNLTCKLGSLKKPRVNSIFQLYFDLDNYHFFPYTHGSATIYVNEAGFNPNPRFSPRKIWRGFGSFRMCFSTLLHLSGFVELCSVVWQLVNGVKIVSRFVSFSQWEVNYGPLAGSSNPEKCQHYYSLIFRNRRDL